MVWSGIIDFIFYILLAIVNFIPNASTCAFTGLTNALQFFGYVVYVSDVFIPWDTIWVQIRIILVIITASIALQTVKLIRGG